MYTEALLSLKLSIWWRLSCGHIKSYFSMLEVTRLVLDQRVGLLIYPIVISSFLRTSYLSFSMKSVFGLCKLDEEKYNVRNITSIYESLIE
jgi:hypothetical protein